MDSISVEEFRNNSNDIHMLNSYAYNYINKKMDFEFLEFEIEFLYNLASTYANYYVNEVKAEDDISDYVFRVDDNYYKSLYFYLRAIKLFEENTKIEWISKDVIELLMKRCYVNIANEYATHFRTIDALSYFRKALNIDSTFDMALGNFGLCIEKHDPLFYGQYEYNNVNKLFDFIYDLYSKINHQNLENPLDIYSGKGILRSKIPKLNVANVFQKRYTTYESVNWMKSRNNLSENNVDQKFSLDCYNEDNYQSWCGQNTLFLNLLNDIGSFKEAQFDTDINTLIFKDKIGESNIILLNNMIYLFCNQREKLYRHRNCESSESKIEVMLVFITLYSFFDKISFFLFKFFNLNGAENTININSIWKFTNDEGYCLLDYKNQHLYNIYWIKKEYRENNKSGDETLNDLLSPDAQEYALYRNVLEHRGFSFEYNPELFYLDSEKMYYKTLKLSKIIRNSILSLIKMVELESNVIDDNTKKRDMDSLYLPVSLFEI